jgi:uncharacterized membrane protein
MRKLWPGLLALSVSAIISALMYVRLPERVVSHWGADGTPNGWSSRFAFVVGIHILGLFVALVLAYAPRVDPRRNNFAFHAGSYWLIANAVLGLVAGATVLAIGINAGWNVHIGWLGYGLGLLFVLMGNVFTRIRPNWIFGVRTPWTLSSDRAWREAHRVAGYGFVLVGVAVLIITALRPDALMYVLLAGVLLVSAVSILRSYLVWKNETTTILTK